LAKLSVYQQAFVSTLSHGAECGIITTKNKS